MYSPTTGTWSTTGSLAAARIGHTATPLPSGKVLVTGGHTGIAGTLASAELYDPSTGTWSETGGMATARESHTAILLPTGQVLVAGGSVNSAGSTTPLASAELYDPSTGIWSISGSLTNARAGHTASLLPNGQVLVAGGSAYPVGSATPLASAELYDPSAGTWSNTGSLGIGRISHTAIALPGGRVLVAGGALQACSSCPLVGDSSAELYTEGAPTPPPIPTPPVTPFPAPAWAWRHVLPTEPAPPPRLRPAAIYDRAQERMIILGGSNGGPALSDVWALSLGGPPVWTRLVPEGPAPTTLLNYTAIHDDARQRMIVFNGSGDGIWALSLTGTPTWTQLTPTGTAPPTRSGHTAIYDGANQRMLIFGGNSGQTDLNDVWALSLDDSLTWTHLSPVGPHPSARTRHTAIFDSLHQRMIVFGGEYYWDLCTYAPGCVSNPYVRSGYKQLSDTWALSFNG